MKCKEGSGKLRGGLSTGAGGLPRASRRCAHCSGQLARYGQPARQHPPPLAAPPSHCRRIAAPHLLRLCTAPAPPYVLHRYRRAATTPAPCRRRCGCRRCATRTWCLSSAAPSWGPRECCSQSTAQVGGSACVCVCARVCGRCVGCVVGTHLPTQDSAPVCPPAGPQGGTCSSRLQQRAPEGGQRVFGWYGRGWGAAHDVARALSYLHSQAGCPRGPRPP